jgi:hypothetical protein
MTGNLRFGNVSPKDMIEKAKRELERLKAADTTDRSDHAMNAALTIAHLADWVFHAARSAGVEVGNFSQFADTARKASRAVAVITDIANASKHFEIDRPRSDAVAVGSGNLILVQDFTFTDFAPPRMPLGGVVRAIRTIIDDDEIVGFETITSGQRIDAPSGPQLFEDASVEAIKFWHKALGAIESGKAPEWLVNTRRH